MVLAPLSSSPPPAACVRSETLGKSLGKTWKDLESLGKTLGKSLQGQKWAGGIQRGRDTACLSR